MAHFNVVMTRPDGSREVLARTRRFNGAVNERDIAVLSKATQFRKHSLSDDRIVVGPTREPDTIAVVLLTPNGNVLYLYSVELDTPFPVS